ncbi:MAG: DUF2975 domain-containing protein [Candidatus Electrothrix aestuarii]|uniref:DUF2975 domain-containing protein n=1 Tax=Candidatus Electrothrix aestuarii TaxID=3062594 RepID=A0AAU8LR40_9BACT|nr:DUF2975 domain-containing protein [Candidatus Electrothrix aestuarii]WPD21719.1 MAG: DUF2975 domain-containing protein [Candidatus Electrothrix sp. GW3-3]
MSNLPKIKKLSNNFHLLISALLVAIPLYYVIYWAFINSLPETLITKNVASVPLVQNHLSIKFQLIGFVVSLLPLSALVYGLINIRKLFSFYKEGVIFSFEHVAIFKKTSKALIGWVFLSILYESAKSVLFSLGNPPGQRIINVGFSSPEITTLVVAGIVFVIAWVMDEGRILTEEQRLTV